MKKFNFIIGALGGALSGYLMSNKKLRQQLVKAKDKKEAAKILGESIKQSGSDLAQDAKELLESESVQKTFGDFRTFANKKWTEVQKEIGSYAKKATGHAKKALKKATKKAS